MAVALGFRAVRGGAVTVGVALQDGRPQLVLSSFLATAAEGDRLAQEPYHVAAEQAGTTDLASLAALVAEGRRRQDIAATEGLRRIVEHHEIAVAALLVNRAGWITDRLQHSLSHPEHPPIAEGLAVRDALRFALAQGGVRMTEMDEKSLPDLASAKLGLPPEATLKSLGAAAGRPWRKEQKLACLAAWVALAAT